MYTLTVSDLDHVRPRFNYMWEGETLYAQLDGGSADVNVPSGIVYEWTIGSRVVQDTTGMYTPTQADVGQSVSVRALVPAGDGQAPVVVTAGAAVPVLDAYVQAGSSLDVASGSSGYQNTAGVATLSTTLAAGQTLHAAVQDADGAGNVHYAWDVADARGTWTTVTGATGADFTVATPAPAVVRVFADYVDNHGTVENPVATLGTNGADNITTAWNQETVYAGAGNDSIHSSMTHHTVDGGAGVDTYVIDTNSYFVTQSAADPKVWDVELGFGAGEATLVNVERVSTPFETLALDVGGVAGQAFRLYQAAFDRTPDLVGLGFWINSMDQGMGLDVVAQAFVGSAEFKSLYGDSPTNTAIVNAFYQHVLHRDGDAAGVQYWADILDRHVNTVAQVLMGFSESAENQAALVGVVQHGIQYTPYV